MLNELRLENFGQSAAELLESDISNHSPIVISEEKFKVLDLNYSNSSISGQKMISSNHGWLRDAR